MTVAGVLRIVETARAQRAWIDSEIQRGRSDAEIVAMAPVAFAFIRGDIALGNLERLVREGRSARDGA